MSNKKTNMDVLKVESLYDFTAFEAKDYINFTKRSGGQVFQYYSLLDSYAKYLGANGGSDFSSNYRETQVVFSREIFKKRIYSSVILPLYSEDSSTNSIKIAVGTEPGSLEERSYFKPRLTPSWYDRHTNSVAFVSGDFRNIYKLALSKVESMVTNSISFVGGDFRLPLLTYVHKEVDAITVSKFYFQSGSLKKVLLRAVIPTESFQNKDIVAKSITKSTDKEKDIVEINFTDINYTSESPKVTPTVLDKFSTKISSPPEPKYLRVLNKRGGLGVKFEGNSSSISSYYDWSLNFNFEPKELRPDAYIIDYPGFISIRCDSRDPSKLIVIISGVVMFTSTAGLLQINTWYNISVEKKGSEYLVYLNKDFMAKAELTLKTFFKIDDYFTLGNSVDTYNGFIGNISNFIIVKRTALVTDNTIKDYTEITPVIGSELDFSLETIKDKNPSIVWDNYNVAQYNTELEGILFNSGQYLIVEEAPDISVYNFNNFKIDLQFSISTTPSLDNKTKTLLHKTGSLSGGYDLNAGYSLSVVRVDDTARLVFQLGKISITSTSIIRPNIRYSAEIIKYKTQLLLFINGVFEGNLAAINPINEDVMSRLILGRFQSIPERDFKGVLYKFRITNYFRDESLNSYLMQYMPENLEYEEILTFEEGILNWTLSDNALTEEDYITSINPKFDRKALLLDDTHKAIIRKNTPLYNLKTKDFTFEGWVNPSSFSEQSIILSNGVELDGPNAVLLQYLFIDAQGFLSVYSDKILTSLASNILIKSNKALTLNVWSHIVFIRESGTFKLYQNGIIVAEVIERNISIDFSINDTYIGNNNVKGNLLPIIQEPALSDYVVEEIPVSSEALEAMLEADGIISVPNTPITDFNAVDGSLTLGETIIVGSDASEVELLRKLHFNKFITVSDIKNVTFDKLLPWLTDGLILKSKPEPVVIPTNPLTVGTQFQGRMDSIRLVKDEALYSGNSFDPPTTSYGDADSNTLIHLTFDDQYKAITEEEILLEFKPTPNITKVNTLVLNSDKDLKGITNNSETLGDYIEWNFTKDFISEGTSNVTLSVTGASLETVEEKNVVNLSTNSAKLSLNAQTIPALDFQQEDFTIELWFYKNAETFNGSYTNYMPLIELGGQKFELYHSVNADASPLVLSFKESGQPTITLNLAPDNFKFKIKEWHHLALVRDKTNLLTYYDGTLINTVPIPNRLLNNFTWFSPKTDSLRIGGLQSYSNYFKGYIDKIRFVKGFSLYKENFDPNKYYEYTPILYNKHIFENNTFLDTTTKLYNPLGSVSFNNSGSFFNTNSLNELSNIDIEDDFTLEFYIKFEENSNRIQTIISNAKTDIHSSYFFSIFRYGNTETTDRKHKIALSKNLTNIDDNIFISEASFENNKWYYITFVKVNNQLKLFINGLLDSRLTLTEFSVLFKNVGFRLGNSIIPESALTGHIESVRYTPDLSLYKNSFDPENIYFTDNNSIRYNYSESSQTVYDSISKKKIATIDNSNTSIVDNVLITRLPDDTSRTGVRLPDTLKAFNFLDKDFTLVFKVKLPEKRFGRITTVYCNRDTADGSASFMNISSDNESTVSYPYRSSVTLYVKQSNVEFNLGENSFKEGEWNTIAFTRFGYTLRGYVNGELKGILDLVNKTLDLRLNYYGGMRLLDAGKPQAGSIDMVYGLTGEALYKELTYTDSKLNQKHSYYSDRFAVTKDDIRNIIPFNTFVESLYTKTESFANVTAKESLVKSSLNLDTNSYVKLNIVPKIPKNFVISFWMKPVFQSNASSSYYSVFKWESDDEYNIDYSITPTGADKLLITKGSLREDFSSSTSGISFIPSEWNHVLITKFENTVALYINGYRLRSSTSTRYGDMFSNLPSTIRLGYNPGLSTKSLDLLLDDIKFSKYKEGSDFGLYYDSLGTLISDYSLNLTAVPILNYDAAEDTLYWENLDNNIISKLDTSLSKYYFTQKSPNSTLKSIKQVLDVSEYLDISSNKIYFSWTQSYDEGKYNYDNKGYCELICYDKNMELLSKLNNSNLNVWNYSIKDREVERYIIKDLPINTAFIEVKIYLSYYSYITNLKMYIENTGQRFDNLYFEEEYLKEDSLLPYSHSLLLDSNNEYIQTNILGIKPLITTYTEENITEVIEVKTVSNVVSLSDTTVTLK